VTVVVDTNDLLVSISKKSNYNWLFQLIINNKITVALTQDIITEYEEQIRFRWKPSIAENFLQLIGELPNAKFTTVYYNLNLIAADVDDNKFVDCAFAANADYIITNDNLFNVLK
jgi:putative PIN family toxin of toxin-antitoxin system